MSGYLDYSGRDDVLSGGARMIPVNTPAGTSRVFEARGETDNPKYMIECHGVISDATERRDPPLRTWVGYQYSVYNW